MEKTCRQFLELLRAGLWGSVANPESFQEGADWKAIIRLAKEQTVLLLVADGYATLPVELQPSRDIQFKVEAFRVRNTQAHMLLNKELVSLSRLMNSNGIRTVLLKGQGLARNYLNPQSRGCGDIDMYVGETHFEKAKLLINECGGLQGEDSESEKHYHCTRGGIDIELHRVAELMKLPWEDRRYQEWTRKHLVVSGDFEVWNTDCYDINLPPVQFNVLYVFYHFLNHFQSSGISLRQICDWVRLLHTHAGQFDGDTLMHDLKSFGLIPQWKVFAQIAVDYLGLPSAEMPLYSAPAGRRARKAFDMMMKYGNFGRTQQASRKPRPKGYYSGKLYSFYHAIKNNFSLFAIFPIRTVVNFIVYTFHGTYVALKGE